VWENEILNIPFQINQFFGKFEVNLEVTVWVFILMAHIKYLKYYFRDFETKKRRLSIYNFVWELLKTNKKV
jgi:hypothetical protein